MQPVLGGRTRAILALTAAAIASAVAEAGVLVLIAQAAGSMTVNSRRLSVTVGPISFHTSLKVALTAASIFALTRLLLQLIVAWLPARISADAQASLRHTLFAAYTHASSSCQDDDHEGHLQELMTSQIAHATDAVVHVANLLSAGTMFVTLAIAAFALSLNVALLVLLSALSVLMALRPLNRFGRRSAVRLSETNMVYASGVSEAVRLAEETQAFGVATSQLQRMDVLIETGRTAYFRYQLSGRLGHSVYQSTILLLIVGGLAGLYSTGSSDLPTLGAAVLMLVRAATYGQGIQGSFHGVQQTLPYVTRIEEAIVRYGKSAPPRDGMPLLVIDNLTFDRIGFEYRSAKPVLQDVSFSVTRGEAIGIIGPSGAGKSTLIQVLLRLQEPSSGNYLINGRPANTYARDEWQRRVAYVGQEPQVFHGTVADNIRFFRDIDDSTIEWAARSAHIHDEILTMGAGYDTLIGQRADAVSGGQRQRICLARALAARPDVLVLDEPTSALDASSEAAIAASLTELHGEVTLFIVAHRMGALSGCNRAILLVDGRIDGFVKPSDLA